MIVLHCPNNLDPYAIEKWSLFLQCKEEGLCKEALLIPTDGVDFQFTLYIHFPTDGVDFQFTLYIHFCYNSVVVEQLYPKSWGYLFFIAFIYKRNKNL